MMKLLIKLDGGILPRKGTPLSAAYDVCVPRDVDLREGRQVIDLLFSIELPPHHAAVIQPRSGFSSKGIECVHVIDGGSVRDRRRIDADVLIGLIDEDYRGHVGVTLNVHRHIGDDEVFILEEGTRIAQMRIVEVPDTEIVEVNTLDMRNDRGGGFGHTGVK